jgi:hypothetical protein
LLPGIRVPILPAASAASVSGDPREPPRLRPFLVSSTRSPLASPRTPIHRLAAAVQSLLYFPDPGPLYAVCGALAANTLRGYPVWLMLIGPPESGKTELLRPLLGLPGVRECGDLSGKAALLSASSKRDTAADATGGLLKGLAVRDAGGKYRGALVMLDFARTVLACDPRETRALMGAIGMLHDQHYQRDTGTDGGRTISFHGRIGFLAACTDAIDHPDHAQANAEMGERCIMYRYPESDGYHEIASALSSPDGTDKTDMLRGLFETWFRDADLDWNAPKPPRELSAPEKRFIGMLAMFTARGRSAVMRDKRGTGEIVGVSRSALGPRLANTFAHLQRGMEHIGCEPSEIRRVLCQCAIDSLPAVRAKAVRVLQTGAQALVTVAAALRIGNGAAARTLEDLRMHGLTDTDRPNGSGLWKLTAQSEAFLRMSDDDEIR